MLTPLYTKQFEKDLKKMLRQGRDEEKAKIIISKLIGREKLNKKIKTINSQEIIKADVNVILNLTGC